LPYTQRAIAIARAAGVPIIHFATDTSGYLEAMRKTGADVVSVDWRVDLDAAWQRLGEDVAAQGNLDPVALLAPWDALKQRAQTVLDQAAGRPGHIFNLGHGILPETPPDNVKRLVDFVHEYSATVHA
jgi:uroporphyrinogen decarboxylase